MSNNIECKACGGSGRNQFVLNFSSEICPRCDGSGDEPSMKEFKVAAKSKNTNSFGLRQHILVARDGQAFSVCRSYLDELERGTVLNITMLKDGLPSFRRVEGELPEMMSNAPAAVVREVWG